MNRFKKLWYSIVESELISDYLGFIQASKVYEESLQKRLMSLSKKLKNFVKTFGNTNVILGVWEMGYGLLVIT